MQNAKKAMEDYVPPRVNVNEVLVDYIGYTYDSSTGVYIPPAGSTVNSRKEAREAYLSELRSTLNEGPLSTHKRTNHN